MKDLTPKNIQKHLELLFESECTTFPEDMGGGRLWEEPSDNEAAHRPGPGWSCRWSERHTAFVAGLGTFGISGGLITRKGIAHRLGSVVTDCGLCQTGVPCEAGIPRGIFHD